MNAKAQFHQQYPTAFFLELHPSEALTQYLQQQTWIQPEETVVSLEKPGEGNMNFVARVITDTRSFIVKQALPWVYKYPQVAAPMDRSYSEATFYRLIEDDPKLQQYTPLLIGHDPQSYVLAQADLGTGADFTFLYSTGESITDDQLKHLLVFLTHLHQIKGHPDEPAFLENRAMRELNHEHIFRYPFLKDNGLDLDTVVPGLQRVATAYQQDAALRRKVEELGNIYLQNGDTLVHGDYYPGSWLRVSSGVRVIDPEFSFFGRPEFDVGVMIAHALLSASGGYSPAHVLEYYRPSTNFDKSLAQSFAGVEVMRRLLGLAQLSLSHSLEKREALLQQAISML